MARLIVTRPRLGPRWDIEEPFDVVIDGNPTAKIALGDAIAMDLPPRPHQVSVRLVNAGSQSVLVDAAARATHRLAVGTNVGLSRFTIWSLILGICPFIALMVWGFVGGASHLRQGASAGTALPPPDWRHAWKMALMVPAALTIFLPMLAITAFQRNHAFVVTEVPSSDLTVEQIARLVRERPFRVRITVRQLMIAVAVVAVCFWMSLEVFRSTRTSQFRSRASIHARAEDMFWEVDGAKADYHAAMRRKYEQAAANGAMSTDPDPSAPP
jgi:hypothetical protein